VSQAARLSPVNFPSGLTRNREVMIASVAKNGKLLECCSPRLQNMLAIVRLAIAQEGRLLKFASLRLRQNHAVILQATKQNPTAIKFAESLSGPLIQSLTEYFGGISRMPRAVVSKLLLHFGLDAIAPKVSTLRSRLERYIIQLKTTNRSVCDLSVQIISTEKARSAGTILHRYGGLGDVLITLQRAMSNGPLTKFGEGDCQKCGHPPSRQKIEANSWWSGNSALCAGWLWPAACAVRSRRAIWVTTGHERSKTKRWFKWPTRLRGIHCQGGHHCWPSICKAIPQHVHERQSDRQASSRADL